MKLSAIAGLCISAAVICRIFDKTGREYGVMITTAAAVIITSLSVLALSPLALERDVGMPRSTFYDQFRKLVNCGYLVQTGGNQYDFYEVPQSDTQTKTTDGQDSPTDKPKNPADDIEINIINNKNSIINTVQGQQVVPASKDFVF